MGLMLLVARCWLLVQEWGHAATNAAFGCRGWDGSGWGEGVK